MAVVTVRNPGTAEVLGEVPTTGAAAVAATVEWALRGQRAMVATPAQERADLLRRVAGLIEAERDGLARLLAAENGTPIQRTRAEVDAAVRIFRAAAGEATRLFGRRIPLDGVPGPQRHRAVTVHEPLGVVAALVPFNHPVEQHAQRAAAALAAGNAVVAQPPARCPLAVLRIAELVEQAGVPRYAHQVVIGGAEVSRRLAELPGVAAVTLSGSTAAGREIARRAAGTLKRVHLEPGGDDALIVCADADVEEAARAVVLGRFTRGNGQTSRAVQRVYVQAAARDAFVDALVAWTGKLSVGDQLLESTDVGPLIAEEAAGRVLDAVRTLVADGARLAAGGIRNRAFVDPTVLVGVPAGSPALAEEVFGPVAPVARFDDLDEAVRLVNASPYRAHAAVFTRDVSRALGIARGLDVGGVVVNGSTALRAGHLPSGGTTDTGGHREGVHDTVLGLTRQKTVVVMEDFR
ncbi:aldehyde dehydrogenase family protein [Dactylosporangium aurantiacum]|uniref:Aldehyde dehydrogenase family protein n=1 Tax=Dactylosporangium aurantiacum TaxID=35754 RepID=A0A9Q9IN32_9ACTN|nr:aldehyde dehydrogenase family protein [Dactylosporangium aurantiacum]MDG6104435.1 aldehyde dehydrogenase family protein [Dactylosporangium aurantiacum]UWZ56055.1 aldehyde dehydrogenase family protein [Dactylosporangium aurantiacum]